MLNGPLTIFGFKDDSHIARAAGRYFGRRPQFMQERHYPHGELCVRLDSPVSGRALVVASVSESPESLFRSLVLAHALRQGGAETVELAAPWIAYGRQDRDADGSVGAGLTVAALLAEAFDVIATLDAHSDRFMRAFGGRLRNVLPELPHGTDAIDLLVAPDRGSKDRVTAAASNLRLPMLTLTKTRVDAKTATAFARHSDASQVKDAKVCIVDDLADSGGTLLSAAKLLDAAGARSIDVHVTHALDLAALRARLHPVCNDVRATYDHGTGKIDPAQRTRLFAALDA